MNDWQKRGIYTLTAQWQIIALYQGNRYRIRHLPLDNEEEYLKAAIAVVYEDEINQLNVVEKRRFGFGAEVEHFNFNTKVQSNLYIAIKRLDSSPIHWQIWLESLLDDDDYLLGKIEELFMAFFPRGGSTAGNVTLQPKSYKVNVAQDQSVKIIDANDNRSALVIRAGNKSLTLVKKVAQDGTFLDEDLIEEVKSNTLHYLPNATGIYKGEIYVVKSGGGATTVSVTEYST